MGQDGDGRGSHVRHRTPRQDLSTRFDCGTDQSEFGTRERRAASARSGFECRGHQSGERSQSATGQPPVQPIACPRQAAADGSQRAAKLRGGLLLGQSLPVAERHHRAVFLREPPDFLLNDRAEFGTVWLPCSDWIDRLHDPQGPPPFGRAAPGRVDPRSRRHPARHAVKPASQRLEPANRTAPPHQHQERRLKSILGVGRIAQHVAANPQNHRPMAQDQNLKSRLGRRITPARKPLEKLSIG